MTSFIGLQTPVLRNVDWFHLFWFGLDSKLNNFMDFLNQTRLDKKVHKGLFNKFCLPVI